MAVHLFCLTSGGGVPLYSRTIGDGKPVPFPVIGSLNGVHMFGSNHNVELLVTDTENSKIGWKIYHNSITLILMIPQDGACTSHLSAQLDLIFNAMVLVYGLEDLISIKNVERFKKEIKVAFPLIDLILCQGENTLMSPMVQAVEIVAVPETSILQNYIDAFTSAADSPYGCIFASGRVVAATTKWWELTPTELVLLQVLALSLPKCSSRDVPIFLPDGSPKVPHRLLAFELVQNVDVCIICGPTPSLLNQQQEVGRFWRSAFDSIVQLPKLHESTISSSIQVDLSMLGFLLVNTESHSYICNILPPDHTIKERKKGTFISAAKRKYILRTYYRSMTGTLYSNSEHNENSGKHMDIGTRWPSKPKDSYLCTETYKCYTTITDVYILHAVYNTTIPNYALRSMTQKTLQILLKDKNIKI